MLLMAEMPEYNKKVAAAALMAPVGYLNNSGAPWQIFSKTRNIQEVSDHINKIK